MKFLKKIDPYIIIYYAIAVATFKHSAWAFGTTIEGAMPQIDWANIPLDLNGLWQILVLLNWFFWGGLMAVATDVGMIATAGKIRQHADRVGIRVLKGLRNQPWHLWGAYLLAVGISALGQVYYSASHAAPLGALSSEVGALSRGGWFYALLTYRVLIMPLSLPVMSFLYTLALRGEKAQSSKAVVDQSTGTGYLGVAQVAKMAGKSTAWVRQQAGKRTDINRKVNGKWAFTEDEAKAIIGGSI
jgi:hypothetical protein